MHRSNLLPPQKKLLIAVSAGADSVALLRLMDAINQSDHWRWKLVVGHVEHGIRGKASRGDARFVEKLAQKLGLRCVTKSLKLKKTSSEAAAREGRLGALRQIVRAERAYGVVMAHHADDQAETVLLRLLRGAGLDGMAGISEVAEVEGLRIVRPLLGIRREALRKYLRGIGQEWREDHTNETDAYLRNRLRRQVMPVLEKLAPQCVEAINRTAKIAHEARGLIVDLARGLEELAMVSAGRREIKFRREILRNAPAILTAQLLRQAYVRLGAVQTPSHERVTAAVEMIISREGNKRIEVGNGVVVSAKAGEVVVQKTKQK